MCRLDPWPSDLLRTMDLIAARPVYRYMNGPSEFTITGTIRDLDLSPRLGEIHLPTLVLGGRYDEVTPVVAEQIHAGIPGARSVTFPESSHVAFWEERAAFTETLSSFLLEVDRGGSRGT
jgi:proline iminopeptidase